MLFRWVRLMYVLYDEDIMTLAEYTDEDEGETEVMSVANQL